MVIGAKPWLANTQHALYEAGKAAVKRGTRQIFHQTHIFASKSLIMIITMKKGLENWQG